MNTVKFIDRVVEKKSTVKQRHKDVIAAFESWLRKNPKATRSEKAAAFDMLSDSAFLRDTLEKVTKQ